MRELQICIIGVTHFRGERSDKVGPRSEGRRDKLKKHGKEVQETRIEFFLQYYIVVLIN
jgi:hypothetical protein